MRLTTMPAMRLTANYARMRLTTILSNKYKQLAAMQRMVTVDEEVMKLSHPRDWCPVTHQEL